MYVLLFLVLTIILGLYAYRLLGNHPGAQEIVGVVVVVLIIAQLAAIICLPFAYVNSKAFIVKYKAQMEILRKPYIQENVGAMRIQDAAVTNRIAELREKLAELKYYNSLPYIEEFITDEINELE